MCWYYRSQQIVQTMQSADRVQVNPALTTLLNVLSLEQQVEGVLWGATNKAPTNCYERKNRNHHQHVTKHFTATTFGK